jgi:site-specific DNA-adenine methylase
VIYLDPPYVPLSATSNFDSYSGGAFGLELQEELASLFRTLDERGCLLIQSNSDTPEVRRLYEGFRRRPHRRAEAHQLAGSDPRAGHRGRHPKPQGLAEDRSPPLAPVE